MMRFVVPGLMLILFTTPATAGKVKMPPAARVTKHVTAHWNKQWPDQEVAHVSLKSEACEDGEFERKVRKRAKKVKTCLLRVDVYIARGYRYLIYRATEAHYYRNRLVSVQLGELEKAWKAGGVPAPAPEQAVQLLGAQAAELLGAEPAVTVVEIGRPRPYGETYRVTLVVDVAFLKDGQPQNLLKVMATLESDGGDWQPVRELLF